MVGSEAPASAKAAGNSYPLSPTATATAPVADSTPKHASWLNMVEIEIGVLGKQCLERRIGDRDTLCREVAHWQHRRNAAGSRVKWLFDTHCTRRKLGRVYPTPTFPDLVQAA